MADPAAPGGRVTDADAGSDRRSRFLQQLGFPADDFQLAAFDVIDDGANVVVAAPTGAGKTVVADYAVDRSLGLGRRVFYTTPIKALSNQKYHDLVADHGAEQVGLLTGDNAINGDAPVVVMTTEVLRNMLYAGQRLDDLAAVVLDEVHYLQDAYRGPVWEEVIIHLPPRIQLVCLSATVSNSDELCEWITTVRGETGLVVETRRPVELDHCYLVGERRGSHLHLVPTVRGERPNPNGFRYDIDPRDLGPRGRGARGRPRRRWQTPDRVDVVDLLHHKGLLPVIHFIFSRAACTDAAGVVLDSGLVLTSSAERERIGVIVDTHLDSLDPGDLDVLEYDRFRAALDAGVAAHHAGMVPPFKEAVEACFVEGLVKVVFATETLALGINMPARSVVIDKLTKFTGDHHEPLTPAQYTQLTGRAGRRGIDTAGTAIVLWSPFVRFEQVADLALSRRFTLTSSFRPTYNMAANLVRRYDAEQARTMLNRSFAQFRADAGVVRSEQQTERLVRRRNQLVGRIEREHGPVDELRAALGVGDGDGLDRAELAFALGRLQPGMVVDVDATTVTGPVAVVSVADRGRGRVRVRVVDVTVEVHEIQPRNLQRTPVELGRIELPEPYLPESVSFLHELADALGRTRLSASPGRDLGPASIRTAADVGPAARKALRRLRRIDDDLVRQRARAVARAETLGGQFDRVLALLADHGHVELGPGPDDGDRAAGADQWRLTSSGQRLARLYHECDLLVVEALEDGVFDGLDPAGVAAVASCLVYEERRPAQRGDPWFPSGELRQRYTRLAGLHLRLTIDETDARLPLTRPPDPGFVPIAHGWAAGGDLSEVLGNEELTGGDFVRTTKQLVDLLRQLTNLAPAAATGRAAAVAAEAMHRDVVSASSLVEPEPDGPDPSATPGP
ncbi:MAG: DEAD/DEAH box helicase [Acidimicrobiales bacterium]